jgi:tetratricopeptide (TPR) repeat protein
VKAFLSHSSRDKQLVQAVAKELGRQFCVLDKQAFETGEQLKKSIEQGLDESTVFVLFASRDALKSIWVEFETDEAWYRRLRKDLTKSLVYLTTSDVNVDDLPEWLRRALIRRERSSKVIARDIRHHLEELLRQRQQLYFFGRSEEVEQLERTLTPLDGSLPPHVLFVTGLPGIGRRSLVKRTTPTTLNLRKHIEIRIREGDAINDICISIADHIEPYSTSQGFERIMREIRQLSDQEALDRTMHNLRLMVESGELPVFYDEGGLLDGEGYIRQPIRTIIAALSPNDDAYIFFVSHRRPQPTVGVDLPVVSVRKLKEDDTKRLIVKLAGDANVQITAGGTSELAEYVAGYPPAAYFAVRQAKDYGLELVLRDKSRLVEFRSSVFLRHLTDMSLGDYERALLRVLAVYSPMPLPVIASVLQIDSAALSKMVIKLIDLALITITEDGYYRIADPVVDAILSAFGFVTKEEHALVANTLSVFLKKQKIDTPRLELSRVLFRAATFANNKAISRQAFHMASDLINLTEKLYHARRYNEALRSGYIALKERPNSERAREFLIRSLIQEERWQEAEEQINQLYKYTHVREVYFLTGFLERKRGNTSPAITSYQKAVEQGKRGGAISRELALCYFVSGNMQEASRHVEVALQTHSDNSYMVDLWAQIATRQRDEVTARKALQRLEIISKPLYYFHRLGRVEYAFGHVLEAQTAAQYAVKCEDLPPFEVLANLAYYEIELKHLPEAESLLGRLDREFRNIRRDIRIGLRCRLEIARGRYQEALSQLERISDKSTFFYMKIKRDALDGELHKSALDDDVRAAYESEVSGINRQVTNLPVDQFLPEQ